MSATLRDHIMLAAVGLMYGANFVVAKLVMPAYISPSAFILFRVFTVMCLFWISSLVVEKEPVRGIRSWRKFFLCAVFGVAVNQLLFFEGLSRTSPINASVIMTAVPIIVLITAYFLLKEPITRWKVVGVILGFTGALLLILDRPLAWDNQGLWGDLMVLGNATSYSIYLVMVKPLMKEYHPVTIMKWIFLIGLVMVIPFGIHGVAEVDWQGIPGGIWLAIAYVFIFPTYFAFLLNATAMKRVSPTLVGYYIYTQPVFSTFISLLLFQESLGLSKILFALCIFLGVFIVNRS